jgi:DinB superfamily
MEHLQYPIGKYEPQPFSDKQKREWLQDIQFLPGLIEMAIENMDTAQLETPYRPGGWNAKQLVHHVADSHMNSYIRFKLAMTEDNPTIKAYDEVQWANMKDVTEVPINISITLLYALHTRWYHYLLSLSNEDWNRTVVHPEHGKQMTLWYLLGLYAWHGKHHTAHIELVKNAKK